MSEGVSMTFTIWWNSGENKPSSESDGEERKKIDSEREKERDLYSKGK